MVKTTVMRFFWKGSTQGQYMAPISSIQIEKPLRNGGLGIINISRWNKAAISKYFDDFINKKDI